MGQGLPDPGFVPRAGIWAHLVDSEGSSLFPWSVAESRRSEPASPLFERQVGWARCGWGFRINCFTVGLPPRNQPDEFPGNPPGCAFSAGRALGGPGNARAEPGLGFPRGHAQTSNFLFLGTQHRSPQSWAHSRSSENRVLGERVNGGHSLG